LKFDLKKVGVTWFEIQSLLIKEIFVMVLNIGMFL